MHCWIESIFSFSSLFWGENFLFEIQIGITSEWIGVFRCGFQQSLSHNNGYRLKCLAKNLLIPFLSNTIDKLDEDDPNTEIG